MAALTLNDTIQFFALAHPIDTAAHPDIPGGARWAVYTSSDWLDMRTCLGAGWAPEIGAAGFIADQAAHVALKVARSTGLSPPEVRCVYLDYDPIPKEVS